MGRTVSNRDEVRWIMALGLRSRKAGRCSADKRLATKVGLPHAGWGRVARGEATLCRTRTSLFSRERLKCEVAADLPGDWWASKCASCLTYRTAGRNYY